MPAASTAEIADGRQWFYLDDRRKTAISVLHKNSSLGQLLFFCYVETEEDVG